MNIAIWGYGTAGKMMERHLSASLSGQYHLTAIFDRDPGRFLSTSSDTGLPILDAASLPDLYQEHLFDAVVITVFRTAQYTEIEETLRRLSVPVLALSNQALLRSPDAFAKRELPGLPDADGYRFHVFRDLYLTLLPDYRYPLIFSENGDILSALWSPDCFYYTPEAGRFFPFPDGNAAVLKGTWCYPGRIFSRNYWHFLYETMDRIYLLEKAGYRGNYILPETAFAKEYLSLAGICEDRVFWVDQLRGREQCRIETLIFPELPGGRRASAYVLTEMAGCILEKVPSEDRTYPARIFIKRIGTRQLEIDGQFLKDHGFTVIVPEELSVCEQIRYFHSADIVLCPHGANSANSLFMHPGSVFIETFPYNYPNACCVDTLYESGVSYLQVSELFPGTPARSFDYTRNYHVPRRMLEMAIQNAERIARSGERRISE